MSYMYYLINMVGKNSNVHAYRRRQIIFNIFVSHPDKRITGIYKCKGADIFPISKATLHLWCEKGDSTKRVIS